MTFDFFLHFQIYLSFHSICCELCEVALSSVERQCHSGSLCFCLQVYNKLSRVEHMTVYEKEAIPSRFHYKKGKFVSPLTLVADEGWFITEVITKYKAVGSLHKFSPQVNGKYLASTT